MAHHLPAVADAPEAGSASLARTAWCTAATGRSATMSRPMPAFGADIREWWRDRTPAGRRRNVELKISYGALALGAGALVLWLLTLARRRRK